MSDKTNKVIFDKPFDFRPDADWRIIVAYQPSKQPQVVTRECAKKAIKAGCARAVEEGKGKQRESGQTKTQPKD